MSAEPSDIVEDLIGISAAACSDIAEPPALCPFAERSHIDVVRGSEIPADRRKALPADLRCYIAVDPIDTVADPGSRSAPGSDIALPETSPDFDSVLIRSAVAIDIVALRNSDSAGPETMHCEAPDHNSVLKRGSPDDLQNAFQPFFVLTMRGPRPLIWLAARQSVRRSGNSCRGRSYDEQDCGPMPFSRDHRLANYGGIHSG